VDKLVSTKSSSTSVAVTEPKTINRDDNSIKPSVFLATNASPVDKKAEVIEFQFPSMANKETPMMNKQERLLIISTTTNQIQ